ncbi:MAG TPA: hypothetical protein VHZ50_18430 [Puia sp.]|jgi:hypothetical protein|nr:hypothetical protein [Puia sp.]
MELTLPITNLLEQLEFVIEKLSNDQYTAPVSLLSNATIGQHARHVIEFFLELDKGYYTGVVNYDKRKRDYEIESNRYFAIQKLDEIKNCLSNADKNLLLSVELNNDERAEIEIKTNYFRELIYNLEHTVHHMALMRIGIASVSDILLPEKFGVAASTIKFRKACAQ